MSAKAADYFSRKHDSGKSRVDLLPAAALVEVGHVLADGAIKYAEDSWKSVPDAKKRYVGALLRHVYAMLEGESHDPETGRLHAAHAACNALFVCWIELRGVK